ncbi:MAG: cysteine hydrolase [Actinomycetota bacterium]|nr:cysteine hydrolase [Actinomycetota bacterium]
MTSEGCDALVVVDVQHVFADPGSPWGSPMWAAARPHVLARLASYGERAVLTRYLAPDRPTGAWVSYFDQWPWALVPPDDPLYALVPEVAEVAGDHPTLDLSTFGKWGPGLAAALARVGGGQPARSVEVVGLATDCCVVSTVLAMADSGVAVTVTADACGGSTPDNHERALALMELYAPLVTVLR